MTSPQPSPAPLPSEHDWIARIRAGDESAFAAMFEAYVPPLCDFVRSYVHTPDTAQELVQSVFLRIWQQRADWRPEGLRAYLFAACRNAALTWQRHERIVARFEERAAREGLAAASGQAPPQPDEQAQASEFAEALRRAIHELPERRRLVVTLRWEHHLSQAEIARVLSVSVRTVETQLARAIVTLRRRLAAFGR